MKYVILNILNTNLDTKLSSKARGIRKSEVVLDFLSRFLDNRLGTPSDNLCLKNII